LATDVVAAIPPLWFRVMNPRTLAWAGGDVSKLNGAGSPSYTDGRRL